MSGSTLQELAQSLRALQLDLDYDFLLDFLKNFDMCGLPGLADNCGSQRSLSLSSRSSCSCRCSSWPSSRTRGFPHGRCAAHGAHCQHPHGPRAVPGARRGLSHALSAAPAGCRCWSQPSPWTLHGSRCSLRPSSWTPRCCRCSPRPSPRTSCGSRRSLSLSSRSSCSCRCSYMLFVYAFLFAKGRYTGVPKGGLRAPCRAPRAPSRGPPPRCAVSRRYSYALRCICGTGLRTLTHLRQAEAAAPPGAAQACSWAAGLS